MIDRSPLYKLADHEPMILMGDDPRLRPMPARPTLVDFFANRFDPIDHLLQSARLAKIEGYNDRIVLACLLHDISVFGFLRADHAYWAEQMVRPYVDEEVSWSIRMHQALRFFPDESVGYNYPEAYVEYFGEDYKPDQYIVDEYERARNHKWYMTSRIITINDVYSFDPDVHVDIEDFTDIIGRNFKQPEEGLGFDNSPCAHLWRTILRPNKFL